MPKICIMASGAGSNAKQIIENLKKTNIEVSLFITDRTCDAQKIATLNQITLITSKDWNFISNTLDLIKPDLIVLAGFLRQIPKKICQDYKIINIHPSLLPKFGGFGMWGDNVHKNVLQSKEKQSGITIHYVTEEYDKGEVIEQHKVLIESDETIESLKMKIHSLEWTHYSDCIKRLLD